jgi:hypothetical protein
MIGAPCCTYVQNVVNYYNNGRVYFVNMQGLMKYPEDYGCGGHPNLSGHKKMAAVAIPIIQQVMGW